MADFLDEMDRCIHEADEAIDAWAKAEWDHMQKETVFKALEATKKQSWIDIKKFSAARADIEFKADPEWTEAVLKVQRAKLKAEVLKKRMSQAERRYEAERSRYSAARKAGG